MFNSFPLNNFTLPELDQSQSHLHVHELKLGAYNVLCSSIYNRWDMEAHILFTRVAHLPEAQSLTSVNLHF